MERMRHGLTLAVAGLIVFGLALGGLLLPDRAVSPGERRRLKSPPDLTVETVMDGSYLSDLELYLLDQFPGRDAFRAGNAVFRLNLLRQRDVNGLYRVGDGLYKLEGDYRPDQVAFAAARMKEIQTRYLGGARVFYAVVPDKNYFVAAQNGYPHLPYDDLLALLDDTVRGAAYIDLFDCLTIDDYYRTDTHWRQERLRPVAARLAGAMGVTLPDAAGFQTHTLSPFYGVYHGQLALPLAGEELHYLTNVYTDAATVYSVESGDLPVYDRARFAGPDGYDVFLAGAQAVLTLECGNAAGGELILFRDSYGSSLAPLLLGGYSKITLIDLRYITSDLLAEYVTFEGQDVLFLYSTSLLNSGMLLK